MDDSDPTSEPPPDKVSSGNGEAGDDVSDVRADLASLERDIENLMTSPRPQKQADDGDGTDQVDLLLKEINELLAHKKPTRS